MIKTILISGPSGVGKGELLKRLRKEFGESIYSVKSVTTREKRATEIDGKDYYFWSKEAFIKAQKKDLFYETASIYGHLYGTLKKEITHPPKRAKLLLIEADIEGVISLSKRISNTFTVFLLPPHLEELKKRLKKRQTEQETEQEKRFLKTKSEIFAISSYNYLIVNDTLDQSYIELKQILTKECENV